jgi:hypothetical protein
LRAGDIQILPAPHGAAGLPAATAAKLERLDMLADLDLLPRNLGVLLE